MISMRHILPGLWGIVSFNILRIVTDLTKKDEFWSGGFKMHASAMAVSVVACYFIAFLFRRKLQRIFQAPNKIYGSPFKEYALVVLQLIVIINVVALSAENRGLIYMGDGFIDYIIMNATYIPLMLLYYTLLRTEIINKNLATNNLYVEKLKADQLDTELQLLKNQYHPHFLFNALNTIYFQIDETNSLAKNSVEQLSELLRYQIYNADAQVSMLEEITFLQSYIAFQKQRLTERLVVKTEFETDWNGLALYPLIFQPLLENAFKYVRGQQEIVVSLKKDAHKLIFIVSNTLADQPNQIAGFPASPAASGGAGLANLRKRLDLLYGDSYTLNTKVAQQRFIAELTITI